MNQVGILSPRHFKEYEMSILRKAVEEHGRRTGLSIREILAAAYYKLHQKQMPERALMDDVQRWNAGECNIEYLYDFMMGTQCASP